MPKKSKYKKPRVSVTKPSSQAAEPPNGHEPIHFASVDDRNARNCSKDVKCAKTANNRMGRNARSSVEPVERTLQSEVYSTLDVDVWNTSEAEIQHPEERDSEIETTRKRICLSSSLVLNDITDSKVGATQKCLADGTIPRNSILKTMQRSSDVSVRLLNDPDLGLSDDTQRVPSSFRDDQHVEAISHLPAPSSDSSDVKQRVKQQSISKTEAVPASSCYPPLSNDDYKSEIMFGGSIAESVVSVRRSNYRVVRESVQMSIAEETFGLLEKKSKSTRMRRNIQQHASKPIPNSSVKSDWQSRNEELFSEVCDAPLDSQLAFKQRGSDAVNSFSHTSTWGNTNELFHDDCVISLFDDEKRAAAKTFKNGKRKTSDKQDFSTLNRFSNSDFSYKTSGVSNKTSATSSHGSSSDQLAVSKYASVPSDDAWETIVNSSLRGFTVSAPTVNYCNSMLVQIKPHALLSRITVKVPECYFMEDQLIGIGKESLKLWKMSATDIHELKQQVRVEMKHLRSEHIMPLVLAMSEAEIEIAYTAQSVKEFELFAKDACQDGKLDALTGGINVVDSSVSSGNGEVLKSAKQLFASNYTLHSEHAGKASSTRSEANAPVLSMNQKAPVKSTIDTTLDTHDGTLISKAMKRKSEVGKSEGISKRRCLDELCGSEIDESGERHQRRVPSAGSLMLDSRKATKVGTQKGHSVTSKVPASKKSVDSADILFQPDKPVTIKLVTNAASQKTKSQDESQNQEESSSFSHMQKDCVNNIKSNSKSSYKGQLPGVECREACDVEDRIAEKGTRLVSSLCSVANDSSVTVESLNQSLLTCPGELHTDKKLVIGGDRAKICVKDTLDFMSEDSYVAPVKQAKSGHRHAFDAVAINILDEGCEKKPIRISSSQFHAGKAARARDDSLANQKSAKIPSVSDVSVANSDDRFRASFSDASRCSFTRVSSVKTFVVSAINSKAAAAMSSPGEMVSGESLAYNAPVADWRSSTVESLALNSKTTFSSPVDTSSIASLAKNESSTAYSSAHMDTIKPVANNMKSTINNRLSAGKPVSGSELHVEGNSMNKTDRRLVVSKSLTENSSSIKETESGRSLNTSKSSASKSLTVHKSAFEISSKISQLPCSISSSVDNSTCSKSTSANLVDYKSSVNHKASLDINKLTSHTRSSDKPSGSSKSAADKSSSSMRKSTFDKSFSVHKSSTDKPSITDKSVQDKSSNFEKSSTIKSATVPRLTSDKSSKIDKADKTSSDKPTNTNDVTADRLSGSDKTIAGKLSGVNKPALDTTSIMSNPNTAKPTSDEASSVDNSKIQVLSTIDKALAEKVAIAADSAKVKALSTDISSVNSCPNPITNTSMTGQSATIQGSRSHKSSSSNKLQSDKSYKKDASKMSSDKIVKTSKKIDAKKHGTEPISLDNPVAESHVSERSQQKRPTLPPKHGSVRSSKCHENASESLKSTSSKEISCDVAVPVSRCTVYIRHSNKVLGNVNGQESENMSSRSSDYKVHRSNSRKHHVARTGGRRSSVCKDNCSNTREETVSDAPSEMRQKPRPKSEVPSDESKLKQTDQNCTVNSGKKEGTVSVDVNFCDSCMQLDEHHVQQKPHTASEFRDDTNEISNTCLKLPMKIGINQIDANVLGSAAENSPACMTMERARRISDVNGIEIEGHNSCELEVEDSKYNLLHNIQEQHFTEGNSEVRKIKSAGVIEITEREVLKVSDDVAGEVAQSVVGDEYKSITRTDEDSACEKPPEGVFLVAETVNGCEPIEDGSFNSVRLRDQKIDVSSLRRVSDEMPSASEQMLMGDDVIRSPSPYEIMYNRVDISIIPSSPCYQGHCSDVAEPAFDTKLPCSNVVDLCSIHGTEDDSIASPSPYSDEKFTFNSPVISYNDGSSGALSVPGMTTLENRTKKSRSSGKTNFRSVFGDNSNLDRSASISGYLSIPISKSISGSTAFQTFQSPAGEIESPDQSDDESCHSTFISGFTVHNPPVIPLSVEEAVHMYPSITKNPDGKTQPALIPLTFGESFCQSPSAFLPVTESSIKDELTKSLSTTEVQGISLTGSCHFSFQVPLLVEARNNSRSLYLPLHAEDCVQDLEDDDRSTNQCNLVDGYKPKLIPLDVCDDSDQPQTIALDFCDDRKQPRTMPIDYCDKRVQSRIIPLDNCDELDQQRTSSLDVSDRGGSQNVQLDICDELHSTIIDFCDVGGCSQIDLPRIIPLDFCDESGQLRTIPLDVSDELGQQQTRPLGYCGEGSLPRIIPLDSCDELNQPSTNAVISRISSNGFCMPRAIPLDTTAGDGLDQLRTIPLDYCDEDCQPRIIPLDSFDGVDQFQTKALDFGNERCQPRNIPLDVSDELDQQQTIPNDFCDEDCQPRIIPLDGCDEVDRFQTKTINFGNESCQPRNIPLDACDGASM